MHASLFYAMQSLMMTVGLTITLVLLQWTVYGAADCPDGGWLFRNRCYWLIAQPTRPWPDASQYCTKLGTDLQLVVIPDAETNDFLVRKLSEVHTSLTNYVWIGLHDFAVEGEWRWVDGSPLNYTNWKSDSSRQSTSKNCGYMRMHNDANRGSWETDFCKYNAAFICSEMYKPPICPNGGTLFRDRCFWLGSKGTLPMREADKACQEEFGKNVRLPVIRNAEMNAFISKLHYATWLGLDDVQTEGEFKWIDGTPLSYTNWAYNEPNNRDGEDCVATNFGSAAKWNDVSCAHENRYICAVPTCYSGPDAPDNNCSASCASCVHDSVCFHNGECRCVPEFDEMTCDKGNFSMSIRAPKTISIGESIDLLCQTNLPVREVDFQWLKTGTNGKKSTVLGTVLPKQGASKISIANMTTSDEAAYICIVTYKIGSISQLETRNTYLEISKTDPKASSQKAASSLTGLAIALAILTIACVVVLVGIVIELFKRRSSKANQDHEKMSEVLME